MAVVIALIRVDWSKEVMTEHGWDNDCEKNIIDHFPSVEKALEQKDTLPEEFRVWYEVISYDDDHAFESMGAKAKTIVSWKSWGNKEVQYDETE